MAKQRELKVETLLMPTLNEWSPEELEPISIFSPDGDPFETSTPTENIFARPTQIALQPYFFSSFFSFDGLNSVEVKEINDHLLVELNEDQIDSINRCTLQFISTAALRKRLPDWQDIAREFKKIVDAGESLLASARRFEMVSRLDQPRGIIPNGVLPAPHIVNFYMREQSIRPSVRDLDAVEDITAHARAAYDEMKALASKKGRKKQSEFLLFLQRITVVIMAAGAKITLPSNELGDNETTRYFSFFHSFLENVYAKADTAIENSSLSGSEKSFAQGQFAYYRKNGRALLQQLREVVSRIVPDNDE